MKGAPLVITLLASSTRAFSPQHVRYSLSSNSLPSSSASSQTGRSSPVTTTSIHQLHNLSTLSSPSYQHIPTKNKHHEKRIRHGNIILFSSTSSDDDSTSSNDEDNTTSKVDEILSKLTSLFPLFVLGSAILGSYVPRTLNWVNNGNLISIMLAG